MAWRVAGSQAVFSSGRSSDADVMRHSPCQPVTIYCVCVVAPAYRKFVPDLARAGRGDMADCPGESIMRNDTLLGLQTL
jgi:hypothetical protein